MIIDSHTHIFPENIRVNREQYFPGEPAFKLLYNSPKSRITGAAELIETMDDQGVDRAVVFGFPWKNLNISKIQNDYIMDAVVRYPDRLIGLCCLDPFSKDALSEILRCFEGGLSGVGELAFYQSGIDNAAIEHLIPVMDVCYEKDCPVLIHTNEPVGHIYPGKSPNTLKQIYDLVRRFPDNKIVLAHWGGGIFFFNLLKKDVKESLKHVYFDTAASPFLYDDSVYKFAVEIIGVDKILFGTDFPLLKPQRYFKQFKNAGLSKDQIDAVAGLNAKKLFKL